MNFEEVEMNENRFLHISDLHFFKSDHQKGRKDGINHFEIKKKILDYISSIIISDQIGAILISGDLELDSTDHFLPYLINWLGVGSKVFIVFGEHDLRDKRNELIESTKDLSGLYIFDEPRMVNDEALDFCVYGMSCESKQSGFTQSFLSITDYKHIKPGIFLTHPCNLPRSKTKILGCKYYAVGHIHQHFIEEIDENVYLGRPGHLYSLWDGDGKAWPVGGIIGEFRENQIHLDWLEFPFPQTVRIYVDPYHLKDDKKLLVIENCSFEKGNKISEIIEGEWKDQKYRGVFKSQIDIDDNKLNLLIEEILKVFIDEIVVTPSDPLMMKRKYGYSRAVFNARTLLNDTVLFNEYMDRIFKASSKTQ